MCSCSLRLEQDLGRVGDRWTSAQDQPGEFGEAEGGGERGSGQQRSDSAFELYEFPVCYDTHFPLGAAQLVCSQHFVGLPELLTYFCSFHFLGISFTRKLKKFLLISSLPRFTGSDPARVALTPCPRLIFLVIPVLVELMLTVSFFIHELWTAKAGLLKKISSSSSNSSDEAKPPSGEKR